MKSKREYLIVFAFLLSAGCAAYQIRAAKRQSSGVSGCGDCT